MRPLVGVTYLLRVVWLNIKPSNVRIISFSQVVYILDYLKPINMLRTSHMAYQIQHEKFRSIKCYKSYNIRNQKKEKKKILMAKKEGRQLSFNLFYYLDTSQEKKKFPKIWKNISWKIISLVYLIFLISYCNTELKRNRQKTTIQLMLTNKIQKKKEEKKKTNYCSCQTWSQFEYY